MSKLPNRPLGQPASPTDSQEMIQNCFTINSQNGCCALSCGDKNLKQSNSKIGRDRALNFVKNGMTSQCGSAHMLARHKTVFIKRSTSSYCLLFHLRKYTLSKRFFSLFL
jgi:hypothetical protein